MNTYADLVKKPVLTKPVYEPGKPIEVVAREYGLDAVAVSKLASNENPLGPSPLAVSAARKAIERVALYPENGCFFLCEKLAAKHGLSPEQFVIGHGSSEIIDLLGQVFIDPETEVVMGEHAFIAYKLTTLLYGGRCVEVPLVDYRHDLQAMAKAITPATKLVFLPCPNNPTGTANTEAEIIACIEKMPDHVILCLDEAYAEYSDNPPDLRPCIASGKKIICTRTFSKIYGLAGLRIGYGYCDAELATLLHRVRSPFNVNSVAQAAALGALQDGAFVEKSKALNRAGLAQFEGGLRDLGLETVPSQGNFILVRVVNANKVFHYLQAKGIIVRPLKIYALPEHLRITVGRSAQNRRLLTAMAEYLGK